MSKLDIIYVNINLCEWDNHKYTSFNNHISNFVNNNKKSGNIFNNKTPGKFNNTKANSIFVESNNNVNAMHIMESQNNNYSRYIKEKFFTLYNKQILKSIKEYVNNIFIFSNLCIVDNIESDLKIINPKSYNAKYIDDISFDNTKMKRYSVIGSMSDNTTHIDDKYHICKINDIYLINLYDSDISIIEDEKLDAYDNIIIVCNKSITDNLNNKLFTNANDNIKKLYSNNKKCYNINNSKFGMLYKLKNYIMDININDDCNIEMYKLEFNTIMFDIIKITLIKC